MKKNRVLQCSKSRYNRLFKDPFVCLQAPIHYPIKKGDIVDVSTFSAQKNRKKIAIVECEVTDVSIHTHVDCEPLYKDVYVKLKEPADNIL